MWRFSVFILSLFWFSTFVFSQSTKASFDANFSKACVGGAVSFTNTSSGSISTSNWDFGDGVVYSSPGLKSTSHSFSNPGKYEVTLTIITSTGSSVEKSKIIEVIPVPNLDFGIDGNKCEVPSNLVFKNSSVKTDGITYSWNFGNGQSNSLYSPSAVS